MPRPAIPGERPLRLSVAALWLATGLLVLHPYYRSIGGEWLGRLGLPDALMGWTCAGEVALGAVLVARPMGPRVAALQIALILGFTAILATLEPMLLAHPFGVLTKNLPLMAVIGTCALLVREGWSPRVTWLLRAGMASIWITEGIVPKLLFQQPMELAVVANSGLVPMDPGRFLAGLGIAQAASGLAVLALRGRALAALLSAQAAALIVLPLLVSWQDPLLWVHPFGPMTKNLPILAGTSLLALRCWRSS